MAKQKLRLKDHIRRESKIEINRLIREYDISDSGGLLLLESWADADTTERNAQDIVNREGMVFEDRFGQKRCHPLLVTIRDARSQKWPV